MKEVIQTVRPRVVVLELDQVNRINFRISYVAVGARTCNIVVCRSGLTGCSKQRHLEITMASNGMCSMEYCRSVSVQL